MGTFISSDPLYYMMIRRRNNKSMDIWIYGYMDIWIYGYLDIWIYGYMDIWIYGYMDIGIYGYMDIWIYGYMDIEDLIICLVALMDF